MAINSRKISGLNELRTLSGEEFLMVALNNKSYKIKTSLLTSDKIEQITQVLNPGDNADNPITITTSDGNSNTFHVYNGSKGSDGNKGKTGDKGETGDTGVALYNTDAYDLILDTVNGKSVDGETIYTDAQLTELILSARQGKKLNDKLEELAEAYCSQEEYDELVATNKVDANTKYYIVDKSETNPEE